jgi:hypothetical protein
MMKHLIVGSLACLALGAFATAASAQIENPGKHPSYGVELEPHLVVQWDDDPSWWGEDGIGLGLRASFPVLDNGPVRTINNSLAIGVGLDWAHFDDSCGPNPNGPLDDDCSADDFWLPVVVQWNFFFSDLISAFPELGIGIEHTRWDGYWCGRGNNPYRCGDGDTSDTDIELVLWLGVRFHLAENFALTLRLGTPSLLLGASFFL